MSDDTPNANSRLNHIYERVAIALLVLMIGFVQVQYSSDRSETKQELQQLDMKVLDLYRTSVTKQELKELETRLTANVEGIRSDIRQILTFYMEPKSK